MLPFLQHLCSTDATDITHNMQQNRHNHAKLGYLIVSVSHSAENPPKTSQVQIHHKNIRPAEYPPKNSIGWPNGRKKFGWGLLPPRQRICVGVDRQCFRVHSYFVRWLLLAGVLKSRQQYFRCSWSASNTRFFSKLTGVVRIWQLWSSS